MELVVHILILSLVAIFIFLAIAVGVLDMADKAESVQKRFPGLERILKKKGAVPILLLVAILMEVGVANEVVRKEVPEIPEPPKVKIAAPAPPQITMENPKIITRTLPVAKPETKCWLSNHFGLPNSTVKGAVTTTVAIIHCNYKIDAPFRVAVEFDSDFIPGKLILPDAGGWMGGGDGKQGRVYLAKINNPALLSEQLVIVTVYGETGQYPRALRASVESLK